MPERENPPGDVPGPRPSLTEEEVRILRLVAEGQATQGIADELGVPYSTARRRLNSILDKLQVRSRLEAVVFAVRHGLVT